MTDTLATTYDVFARDWARGTSPLYEEWSHGIAGDVAVLDLIASLPRPMQQPNRIFAAARWAGSPLGAYPIWREWLLAHWADVVAVATVRTTQTNEPGRCATLLPPMSQIVGPLALIEVGAAAGLCLFPDRYAYAYDTPAGDRVRGDSPVVMPCRLDDDNVPAVLPDVVWRCGIDLDPIDAGDPESIDWLATLVWPGPDHDGRVSRLRAAAAVVAASAPTIVTGNLLEVLPDVARQAPRDATLVVYHSAVLLYLDAGERRRFVDVITALQTAFDQQVVWISNETAGTLPEIDAQLPEGLDTTRRFVQTVDGRAVALAGQHGASYERAPFAR